jgi:hypothetical protein
MSGHSGRTRLLGFVHPLRRSGASATVLAAVLAGTLPLAALLPACATGELLDIAGAIDSRDAGAEVAPPDGEAGPPPPARHDAGGGPDASASYDDAGMPDTSPPDDASDAESPSSDGASDAADGADAGGRPDASAPDAGLDASDAGALPDADASAAPDAVSSGCAAAPAWAEGVFYQNGQHVTYSGVVYMCMLAHTSQPGWTPDMYPALWQPGTCPDD